MQCVPAFQITERLLAAPSIPPHINNERSLTAVTSLHDFIIVINREAGEIIRLVVTIRLSVFVCERYVVHKPSEE